jgi:hypothetical protein
MHGNHAACRSVTSIEKEGGGADVQPAPGGGGDTKARQQNSEEGDAIPDLVLKHPNGCNICLNADETFEICI